MAGKAPKCIIKTCPRPASRELSGTWEGEYTLCHDCKKRRRWRAKCRCGCGKLLRTDLQIELGWIPEHLRARDMDLYRQARLLMRARRKRAWRRLCELPDLKEAP